MALPTWVESINGYAGDLPFHPDKQIVLDSTDIHVTGGSGTTVKTKCQGLAEDMEILTVEQIPDEADFCVKIASYPLVL